MEPRRIVALTLLASACGTLPNGRTWGQDVTLLPSGARLGQSLEHAVLDPWTWGPLGAAAVLTIDDWDEDISDWAIENQPVFGSTENAEDWASDLRSALYDVMIVTSLATPSGDEALDWTWSKTKGVAVVLAAKELTGFTTDQLKQATDRERPDGSDDRSMPSGHTTSAFGSANICAMNLKWIDMGEPWRRAASFGIYSMAFGTGWARVESGAHYPTDILVGAAVGNFVTTFVYDAFLGLPLDSGVSIGVEPTATSGVVLTLNCSW